MSEPALYAPGETKERIVLTPKQKNDIKNITLSIDEVDKEVREEAVPDVIATLQNGHGLNKIITNDEGEIVGYVACEDFAPGEAYVKYLGSTRNTGKNLLAEIPAFIKNAKNLGYEKITFHGWNNRLNKILTRYGFQKIRTDEEGSFKADFYEKEL